MNAQVSRVGPVNLSTCWRWEGPIEDFESSMDTRGYGELNKVQTTDSLWRKGCRRRDFLFVSFERNLRTQARVLRRLLVWFVFFFAVGEGGHSHSSAQRMVRPTPQLRSKHEQLLPGKKRLKNSQRQYNSETEKKKTDNLDRRVDSVERLEPRSWAFIGQGKGIEPHLPV